MRWRPARLLFLAPPILGTIRHEHLLPSLRRGVRGLQCLADGADRQPTGTVGEMDGRGADRSGNRGVSTEHWASGRICPSPADQGRRILLLLLPDLLGFIQKRTRR